jgi:hypothetical protein
MSARWLWLCLPLAACAPDFTEPWEVTKPRLMVAKLSIDGDSEGRTRPRPGESFSLRYFMMSPGKPEHDYSAAIVTCIGALLPNGQVACIFEAPLAPELQPEQGDDQLLFTGFQVPEELAELSASYGAIDRAVLYGSVCVDGQIERVPGKDPTKDAISSLFRCTDNDDSKYKSLLPFSQSVFFDLGEATQENHHPSFACDESAEGGACNDGIAYHDEEPIPGPIVLERPEDDVEKHGGERVLAWPAWPADQELPWDGCADAPETLPKIRAKSGEHTVHVRFDPGDREEYQYVIEENGEPVTGTQREEPIVSHAITTHGGELGSYATALARDVADADAEIHFDYTPPGQSDKPDEHIDESGRLVRFYFALRDQRGGSDFTTRELCLLPPED